MMNTLPPDTPQARDGRVNFARPFIQNESVAYLVNLYFELQQKKQTALEGAEYEAAVAYHKLADSLVEQLDDLCKHLASIPAMK